MKLIGLTAFVFIFAGCGGGGSSSGNLSISEVTNIPDGDGTGLAFTDSYNVDIRTISCSGSCPAIQSGIFTITLCDVGDRDQEIMQVTQRDGHLEVDGDGLYINHMEGGIFQDGSFEVGGYATEYSGGVDITGRVEGSITSEHQISATAILYARGSVEDTNISCKGTYEINSVDK